jgi:hypothetical protein
MKESNVSNVSNHNQQFVILDCGTTYPLPLPANIEGGGAAAQFLNKNGSMLQIILPWMSTKEKIALRRGTIKSGLLYRNGAMLFLFQFYGDNGKPILTFDAPFDIRILPPAHRYLPNIDNAEQRLAIDLHGVDGNDHVLKALRLITMPPGLTIKFLSAVQDQLVETRSGNKEMEEWLLEQPETLIKKTQTWVLGS